MKKTKYHIGTVPKSNRKIDSPNI